MISPRVLLKESLSMILPGLPLHDSSSTVAIPWQIFIVMLLATGIVTIVVVVVVVVS